MPDDLIDNAVLIAGPTASGKSALALRLAEALDGEIVNADALQVYQDLHILSARPSAEDELRAPHHLYGTLDGAERCSAGAWARMAEQSAAEIFARGKPAIFVGGTGLYFRALERGLSPMPAVDEASRLAAQARLEAVGAEAFHAEVVAQDPEMARLAIGDRQRLVRAWSVYHATGEPLSQFQAAAGRAVLRPRARLVIAPPRETLYARCEARFEQMLAAGALKEAGRLRARGLAHDLPVMKALGAAELIEHLDGACSLTEAVDLAKRNTRRFAKRQMTWFRGQTPDWPRCAAADDDAFETVMAQWRDGFA